MVADCGCSDRAAIWLNWLPVDQVVGAKIAAPTATEPSHHVLDQYQFDDVLDAPQKTRIAPSATSGASSGSVLLAAAVGFDPLFDLQYQDWLAADYSALLEKHLNFSDVAQTGPSRADWQALAAGLQLALLCGDTEPSRLAEKDAWLAHSDCPEALAARSAVALFTHHPQQSIDLFSAARGASDGSLSSTQHLPRGLVSAVHALALIQRTTQQLGGRVADGYSADDRRALDKLISQLGNLSDEYQAQYRGDCFMPVLRVLADYVRVLAGQRKIEQTFWLGGLHVDASAWLDLFLNLCRHWLGEPPDEHLVARLASHVERASDLGLHWYVDEGLTLLSAQGLHRASEEFLPQLRSSGWLLNICQQADDWQADLEALSLTVHRHTRMRDDAQPAAGARRVSWWLSARGDRIRLEPREQRLRRDKHWGASRLFPLKLLLDECGTLDFLCGDDLKICAHLRNCLQDNHALYYEKFFEITTVESLELILRHPRLFREDPDLEDAPSLAVTVRKVVPTLQVVRDDSLQEITLSMAPFPDAAVKSSSDFHCYWTESGTLSIEHFSEGQLDIAQALGFRGLNVPLDAADSVLESLRSMASLLEVHSDVSAVDTSTVVADTKVSFQLRPLEQGLDVTCCIYPLGANGPCVVPGQGKPALYTTIAGRARNTVRDLPLEQGQAQAIIQQLPLPVQSDQWQWTIADAESALELLAALQDREDEIDLLWPASERIAMSTIIDTDQMHIQFSSQRNGIDVAGELKLESDQYGGSHVTSLLTSADDAFDATRVNLKKLLASLDQAKGRFIQLDDGKILQLSRRLKQQLEMLRAASADGPAHEHSVPVLVEASRGMVLRDDDSWNEQLERLREAESLMPEPPAALQAQLRDYQLQGYRWMTRLAHWGAGACLADDMGLGKTMQSLSLILQRADGGPTLVVAPTSVCGNWLAEAAKFAPSLRLIWLGDGNRARKLRNAKPHDLFVCSYGVLQNEIEMLREMQWQTIIADEAQSFKNPGTRRSQAMMALQGRFRMIATGTPIENHLGELWNLFRFINPGLLGSSQTFKERYAHPIELREDECARDRLKSLIRPFILRRLKREVLTELPPRTEITHLVEFDEQQRAFYEGLRKQALSRISELSGLDSEQRFRVLAEITTLRQASCHPKLVTDTPPCDSAKLNAFAKIVEELRHNGHRCLVFSQFVGHLALIREYLDARRISYQYLDGATSVKHRKKAVDDFQAGEGELFLISLKAGGSGLNLTAADYVIHMDPWWNPAVEDQASDRAYRMGQKRPVTIYRLVVKDTIEEKIVDLHAQKRDLANALLEGTDSGSRLSVEQLVELIDDESQARQDVD